MPGLVPASLLPRRARVQADPRHARWLLLTCLVGMFSTSFPNTLLTVSVARIADDLGSVPSTITWVTTAPMLAAAVATPIVGRLGDLRGHRRTFLLGASTTVAFALLTALAWDATSLIAFRTIAQTGAAATVPASFALVFRSFPGSERVRASAMVSATFAGAAVTGVVVGGPMVDAVGWRPIFVVQAVVAGLALLPALVVLPDDAHHADDAVDWAGAVALAVAAFTVTFGINRLGVWGPEPVVLVALVVAPVAVWALVRIESRVVAPLLPLRVLRHHDVRWAAVGAFVVSLGWMGNFVITPLLLQSAMGLSVGATSLVSVPRALAITASAPVASRLGMRHGERRLVTWAAVGLCGATAALALTAALDVLLPFVAALTASGWALGHVQPGFVAATAGAVDEGDFGVAASMQQTANQIGGVVGVGLFTAIAADATATRPYVVVYVLAAVCALGGAAAGAQLGAGRPRRRRRAPSVVGPGARALQARDEGAGVEA